MSITDRSAASTDPIEQTVQFGRIAAAIEYLYDHAADQPTLAQLHEGEHPFHEQALSIFGGGGERIALHLKGTPFQVQVWRALLNIPQGSVQSYGSVAESIGRPRAARAVGTAVGHNPVAMIIPCHRVIRESGVIGDYRWGRGRKMALLAQELGAA